MAHLQALEGCLPQQLAELVRESCALAGSLVTLAATPFELTSALFCLAGELHALRAGGLELAHEQSVPPLVVTGAVARLVETSEQLFTDGLVARDDGECFARLPAQLIELAQVAAE